MFLTDGIPTLPDRFSTRANTDRAIDVASKAARRGVHIHTFAIGREATREPRAPLEIARVTDGVFAPVADPRDLQAAIEGASFSEIAELRIRNATTSAAASYQLRNPDGTYSALVPMQTGRNVIEVFARSTDGLEATRQVEVELAGRSVSMSMSERQNADLARLRELRRRDNVRSRRVGDVEITPDED